MRFTTQILNYIEEMSRNDTGIIGKSLRLFLYHTLADKLFTPLNIILFNPFLSFLLVLVIYLIFLIIYVPLWAISFVITVYGSYFLFILFLNTIAVTLARSIAYPGSNSSIQKQISTDFIKRISIQLETISGFISDFSASLLLFTMGEIPLVQYPLSTYKKKQQELLIGMKTLIKMKLYLSDAIEYLIENKQFTSKEVIIMKDFMKTLETFIDCLNLMIPEVKIYSEQCEMKLTSTATAAGGAATAAAVGGGGMTRHQQLLTPTMTFKGTIEGIKSISSCLKAAEALKAASITIRPVNYNDSDNEINFNISTILKQLINFNKGLEGSEKITFPYLRALLKHRYGTEHFIIPGRNKNYIDGVIFPAIKYQQQKNENEKKSSSIMKEDYIKSTKGMVLFCSPNAGFYELIAHADMNNCWIGFYLERGYDICMFNYRGYGLSTGYPSPLKIKSDVCEVYKYIQKYHHPLKLIVHGESIGGLCASHLATNYPIDLLICDRTFASLESTAVKLLGSWAAYGLQIFAWWNTDVTSDFLSCTCPKLIFQDHNDEIIHNVAGLKSGIALRVVMGDMTWKSISEPRDYIYASYMNAAVPNSHLEEQWLSEANDLNQNLSEGFITHFYGCLMELSKQAALTNTKIKNSTTRGMGSDISRCSSDVEMARVHSIRDDEIAAGDEELVREVGNDTNHNVGSVLRSNVTAKMNPPPPMMINDNADPSGNTFEDFNDQSDVEHGSSYKTAQFNNRQEWLEAFCKLSIYSNSSSDPRLKCNPQIKIWAVVARIDGGSGQLLGQAVAKGMDSVRCWISSYIVWKKHSSSDPTLPSGATTMATALKELNELSTTIHPAELGDIPSVIFLKAAFQCIIKRQESQKSHKPEVSSLLGGAASYHTRSRGDNNSIEEGRADVDRPTTIQDTNRLREDVIECLGGENSQILRCLRGNSFLYSATLFISTHVRPILWWNKMRTCLSFNSYVPIESCATSVDASYRSEADAVAHYNQQSQCLSSPYVGELIPLHCGHNGWPSNHSVKTFSNFLEKNNL